MYDYISIHSAGYAKTVRTEVLERFIVQTLGFEQTGPLQFSKGLHGTHVGLKGISANSDGSYAYYTLEARTYHNRSGDGHYRRIRLVH